MAFRTLDNLDVADKRVLLRADLNVPVRDGKITDRTQQDAFVSDVEIVEGAEGHGRIP